MRKFLRAARSTTLASTVAFVALAPAVILGAGTALAQTSGGSGGNCANVGPCAPTTAGGSGGVSSATGSGGGGGPGGGIPANSAGGGGGGAGTIGGTGGIAGGGSGAGGAGGASAGANGGAGSGGGGGQGGAGGGGGAHGAVVTTSTINSAGVAGGGGGAGGSNNGSGGGGGGGGAGGYGVVVNGSGIAYTNNGAITGGAGGNGGAGGGLIGGNGGNGGGGGYGIDFTGNGTLTNTATITGGTGGAGGTLVFSGGGSDGTAGAGGVGVIGAGLTVIDSGTISGGLAGDGVTRADAIQFTFGSNTLQLQSGYNIVGNVVGTGNDAFQLGGSGSSTFNLNSFGSTQQYQGFATFSVVGGNWTLTGANATAVPFSVNNATATVDGAFNDTSATVTNGTLTVNGSISDPIIGSGGILNGTGSVGDTTIESGGTFAPGNGTPGSSMMIAGNLAFQSGALYLVYLNPTASSFATVTGTATLAGTVQANFASGSYVAKQYTILTANGGVSGTFSGISNVNLPSGASDNLSYGADNVYLNLTPGFVSYTGLSGNQQGIANALTNFFNTTGGIPSQFFGLTPGGLTQIDGEDATGAERGAFDLMNEFLGLMLDPFVDGRGGSSTSSGALGFAPNQQDGLPPDIALAYAGLLKAPPPQTFTQRWSTWAAGFGGSATTNGDPTVGSNNVTTSTYGYAAGMDYHYSPDTVFGFSLAGGGTNWNLANALGTGRSDALLAGVYGVTHEGPWYLGGALAFANNWFTTNRTAMGDQLTARFQGQSYSARLEGGYRFAVPSARDAAGVTPYAAVQAQDFHTPAYSETDLAGGGLGLAFNAMNGTDTRSELGARFDDLTALANLPLILRAKVAWAHDWASNPSLNASFESLPGTAFTVFGAPIPQNSALASAGAQLFFTPNWSLLAKFDGEFASGYALYAGSGTLRYTW